MHAQLPVTVDGASALLDDCGAAIGDIIVAALLDAVAEPCAAVLDVEESAAPPSLTLEELLLSCWAGVAVPVAFPTPPVAIPGPGPGGEGPGLVVLPGPHSAQLAAVRVP